MGDEYRRLSSYRWEKSSDTPLRDLLSSYVPILEWLPQYDRKECLKKDVASGITLGCVLLGQSLAHAALCGVSVVHGPYSCLVPPIVYAVFGTCHQGSVGTGGLLALLTGIQLRTIEDPDVRARAAAILCVIVGGILTLMGIFQLSFLVRFLSRSALSGFVTGSALLIMKAMFMPMLGLPEKIEGQGLLSILWDPLELEMCNPGTVGLSVCVFLFLFLAKRLLPKAVADFKELIVLAVGSVFCYCFPQLQITVVGSCPRGLPSLSLPVASMADVQLAKELLPGGALIAVVCFISSFASAKKCALKGGYRVVALNELLAMGFANVSGGFFGGVPVQIGLSRSALAANMGTKTQLGSNVFVAAVIAVILLAFSPLLGYIPSCVLNTIIFNAATHLFEFNQARRLYKNHTTWRERKDYATWHVAFAGTIILGAFDGILAAGAISLFFALHKVVNPDFEILGRLPGVGEHVWVGLTRWKEAITVPGVLVVRIDGPLFYANSERFQEQVDALEVEFAERSQPLRAIVLNASSISFVDDTAIQVLKEMMRSWRDRGIRYYMAGAHGAARDLMMRTMAKLLDEQDDINITTDDCVRLFQEDAAQEQCAKAADRIRSDALKRQGSIRPMPTVLSGDASEKSRSRHHRRVAQQSYTGPL